MSQWPPSSGSAFQNSIRHFSLNRVRLNVPPRPASENVENHRFGHAGQSGQKVGAYSMFFVNLLHGGDLIFGKSGRRVHGTGKTLSLLRTFWLPSLADHVSGVVEMGPQEQVIGTDADSVVAPVADEKAVWDWPVVQLPGEAVGGRCAARPKPEPRIDTVSEFSFPGPAVVRLDDVSPEPFLVGDVVVASLGAEGVRMRPEESDFAALAGERRGDRMLLHREPLIRGAVGSGADNTATLLL